MTASPTIKCHLLPDLEPTEREEILSAWPEPVEILPSERISEAQWVVGDSSDPRITVDWLRGLPDLRVFQALNHGINFYQAPEVAAEIHRRGIIVCQAPTGANAVAEFAALAMLTLSRRAVPVHEALAHHGDWSDERRANHIRGTFGGELAGSRAGVISLGHIGRAIARKAAALGMEVWGLTGPGRPEEAEGLDLAWSGECSPPDIDTLVRNCPYLILALPLLPATRNLIDRDRLRRMPADSYFINVARGEIADEAAVFEQLESGHLAGAALDVWHREAEHGRKPGPPSQYPFHRYNTLLTPHYAGMTRETRLRAFAWAGDNLRRHLAGEDLRAVTPPPVPTVAS